MNRKISVNLALAIAIIAMTVVFSVTIIMSQNMFDKTVSSVRQKELEYKKIAEIDKTVRAQSYYPIDDNTLFDMLGAGYMAGISDQGARYYTAKQYTEYLNEQAGKSIGIGAEFIKEMGNYPRVIRVYGSSPASDLGIVNGYTLRQIDGTDLKNLTIAQINALLRGEDGTKLMLGYADPAGTVSAPVEVQRRQYETPSIETRLNENEVIGYIKINSFNGQTAAELQRALDEMRAAPQGFQGLIVDVRNNTGGTLKYALDALDTLCPAGPMGYQQSKEGEPAVLGISDEAQQINAPVAVLVNGNTASGAELFASAVRDFGIGQIVGVKTAGKGNVQCTPVRLSDGSAISYTVGTLLTSKGEPFDGAGLVPDVEAVLKADEERNFYDLSVDADSQIAKAREAVAGVIARAPANNDPAANSGTPAASEGLVMKTAQSTSAPAA